MVLVNSLGHPSLHMPFVAFLVDDEIWMVSEFMDCGSMANVLTRHFPSGIKDLSILSTLLKAILKAIEYLHSKKQIHREIKASNLLTNSTGEIKLCDFGLITRIKGNKKNCSLVGSLCWMAPEMLDGQEDGYDEKIDIWSFGITALELAYGKPPNSEITSMKAIVKTLQEEPPSIDKTDGWDISFVELIEGCLKKNPNERKSAKELLKLKFFAKAKSTEFLRDKLFSKIGKLEDSLSSSFKNQAFLELQNYSSKGTSGSTMRKCKLEFILRKLQFQFLD